MSKLYKLVKEEILHAIPSIIYFFIAFAILHFTVGLLLKPDDVRYTSFFGVIVGAILTGKVIIIVDCTRFIDKFPNKPLIYNIAWKTTIYTIATILLQLLENFIKLMYSYKDTTIAVDAFKHALLSPQFWAVQILIAVLFLIYVVACEFAHALGWSKVKSMLWG